LAISSFLVMLNNGRTCQDPWQCVSLNCHNGVCSGLTQGEFCYQHSDCDAQLFCSRATVWPWENRCAKLRTSYEQCKETYECSLAHYCWYASDTDKKESIKKCLPLYSQDHGTRFGWQSEDYLEPTFDDYKYNG